MNNDYIYNVIKNSYLKNRLSHAYLFSGKNNDSKKKLALKLSKMLYCESEDPCLSCKNCLDIEAMQHINVKYLSLTGQNIKKEQIIDLQNDFSKTSLVDGYRIYIIDGVESLSTSAANSLLKFIEEPISNKIVGFLLTDNIDLVLPTIISRCQTFYLKEEMSDLISRELRKMGFEEHVGLVSNIANDVETAKTLLENDDFLRVYDITKEVIKGILDGSKGIMSFFNNQADILDDQENIDYFLRILIFFYSELLHQKSGIIKHEYDELTNLLKDGNNKLSFDNIKNALDVLCELEKRLKYNVNYLLQIEQAILKLEVIQ